MTVAERTPVPENLTKKLISHKQANFIEGLMSQREVPQSWRTRWAAVKPSGPIDGTLDGWEQEGDIDRKTATKLIDRLLAMPRAEASTELPEVPAGRYAVDSNEGELRFYQVWRSKDGQGFALYVLHGTDSSRVRGKAVPAILAKIAEDVRGAAIRFGNEIGACSNCGRRLTNRISRELGIGPVCGGRMFEGDDWSVEVKAARQRIIDRGEDPNEEVE